MNKNRKTKLRYISILSVVLVSLVGSLSIILIRNNRWLQSELIPGLERKEIEIPDGAHGELPHQIHFITGWDRCLDQLRIDCDVAFLGDSITYKSSFFQEFPDLTICNLGVCSDTIKAVNMRVGTLWTIMPEHVFLMIGINSLKNDNLDECIEDYRTLVDNVITRWDFQLYIMSVTPKSRNESGEDDPSPEIIASFNEAIAKIAEEKGAIYVDLYSQIVDESGYVKDVYTADGLHISDEAYKVWADLIRPYIAG